MNPSKKFLLVLEGYGIEVCTSRFFFRCCQQHSIKMMLMVFFRFFWRTIYTSKGRVCSVANKNPQMYTVDTQPMGLLQTHTRIHLPWWKQCKQSHPSNALQKSLLMGAPQAETKKAKKYHSLGDYSYISIRTFLYHNETCKGERKWFDKVFMRWNVALEMLIEWFSHSVRQHWRITRQQHD